VEAAEELVVVPVADVTPVEVPPDVLVAEVPPVVPVAAEEAAAAVPMLVAVAPHTPRLQSPEGQTAAHAPQFEGS
jgi:hypothetical protein